MDWDRYLFVLGNPGKFIDPDGHNPTSPPIFPLVDIPIPERTDLEVELAKKSNEEKPNLTDWLLSTMMENQASETVSVLEEANATFQKPVAYYAWAETVRGGGPWDFKVELRKFAVSTIQLGDYFLPFDTLANIHFGYEGRAVGFSYFELQAGAGVAQIFGNTSDWGYFKSYFDAPMDNLMIQIGGWLYDEFGDKNLTEGMLNSAFDKFFGYTDDNKLSSKMQ